MKTALAGLARIYKAGRPHVEVDGILVPLVSGGDGSLDLGELRDERARALSELDGILRTAESAARAMTDEELARHGELNATVDVLDGLIARAEGSHRSGRTPSTNRIRTTGGDDSAAARSLDELLWATADTVAASTPGAYNTVERVAVRSDSGFHHYAPRIGELAAEERTAVRSFQQLVADMAIFGLLVDSQARSSVHGFEVARSHVAFRDQWNHALRALDVDTSGEGGTWVPTGIGASLHEKVRASGKIAPLFPRIDLPTNPWKMPIEGGDSTAYRVAEPTGDTESKMTASTPGTVAATFDAEIFGARTLWSRSVDADSAVAMLPFVQRKLVRAFVTAEETSILDGDSDGTHQDSDVGASTTDARSAWDGLRKKALAQTVATATSTTVANLAVIRKAMGKWGLNPADLAFIVGVSAMHALLADTTLLTVDKMGPQATILNGQIGTVYGVPVIVSEHVRENLNASGVYDGITTTKTYNLCVNRQEWALGQRMALDVEVDDSIYRETYQRVGVAFSRVDFQNIGDAATNEDTAIAYNVTP